MPLLGTRILRHLGFELYSSWYTSAKVLLSFVWVLKCLGLENSRWRVLQNWEHDSQVVHSNIPEGGQTILKHHVICVGVESCLCHSCKLPLSLPERYSSRTFGNLELSWGLGWIWNQVERKKKQLGLDPRKWCALNLETDLGLLVCLGRVKRCRKVM